MFIHDPNVNRKEAIYLIKEIVSAIKKISTSSSSSPRQILGVISWNHHHQSSYNDILLSKLDKRIEITDCITSRRKRLSSASSSASSLSPSSVKVKFTNNKDVKYNSNANNTNAFIYFRLEI